MLHCRYCNYLITYPHKNESTNVETFICEYANLSLPVDFEEQNDEYPCCKKT
ncbi:MAG: hypothetical protein N3I35_09195 [Clostridia bacterium]|nr:hypothetical protein [Clostridia bacterium]